MASGFNDFEQLARQYWNAWGEAMRAGQPAMSAPAPGWNEALGWWSQLARGAAPGNAASGTDEALHRFDSQARQWFGQMQQLAAQFAGRDAGASEIAAAWQKMLGGGGTNAFADLFKAMPGPGQFGVEQWMEQMAPLLQAMQRDGRSWLGLPAFGFAREHQERWQQLARAQLDYQEKTAAYNALMGEATQLALRRFEDKLAARSAPGKQVESARALFDLWIDAAEEAYAEIALSPRFREVYGELLNAHTRVRAGVQKEVEQYCQQLGIPTRTEVDAAHRKIVQLERELRRLRDTLHARESQEQGAAGTDGKGDEPKRKPAKKATAKGGRR